MSRKNQITLGEVTVDEKSNEITAVFELLDLLDIDDTIITADAMSCQKTIVEKITAKNADYVIGLKSNRRALYNYAGKLYNENVLAHPVPEVKERYRGHDVTRKYYLKTDIDIRNILTAEFRTLSVRRRVIVIRQIAVNVVPADIIKPPTAPRIKNKTPAVYPKNRGIP